MSEEPLRIQSQRPTEVAPPNELEQASTRLWNWIQNWLARTKSKREAPSLQGVLDSEEEVKTKVVKEWSEEKTMRYLQQQKEQWAQKNPHLAEPRPISNLRLAMRIMSETFPEMLVATIKNAFQKSRTVFQTKVNFKELFYIFVGPPLEIWHWAAHKKFLPWIRRKWWVMGRTGSMVHHRLGLHNWYGGTGFQRKLFRYNFLKARSSSPLGGRIEGLKFYALPSPVECEEIWKRKEKTNTISAIYEKYLTVSGTSRWELHDKAKRAMAAGEWVPEVDMYRTSPPTRLQLDWYRKRMKIQNLTTEYWTAVNSTLVQKKEQEFLRNLELISKKDKGLFATAWLNAKQRQFDFIDSLKKRAKGYKSLLPFQNEVLRKEAVEEGLFWRDRWNWANPSQLWPWGNTNFSQEIYDYYTPIRTRLSLSVGRFFWHLKGGNQSFKLLDIGEALWTTRSAKLVAILYTYIGYESWKNLREKNFFEQVVQVWNDINNGPLRSNGRTQQKKTLEKTDSKLSLVAAAAPTQMVLNPFEFPENDVQNLLEERQKLHSPELKEKVLKLQQRVANSRYLPLKDWLNLKFLEWRYPEFSQNGVEALQKRMRWTQEDLANSTFLQNKRKERLESAKAFKFNAIHGETSKRMGEYREIIKDVNSDSYIELADNFKKSEPVPEWPFTADYRNDYYWRVRVKTPFPPGFAGDFLRKLEDENWIETRFSNPNIYYPQGRPESEWDYLQTDVLLRRLVPEMFPNDEDQMKRMIQWKEKASWATPGVIEPLVEHHAIPELSHFRGWRMGMNDNLSNPTKWPNKYDDPVMYTDWSKEPIALASPEDSTLEAGKWRWDKQYPSSLILEDAAGMAAYDYYTSQFTGQNIRWSSLPTVDENLDDIDADFYYQSLRQVDEDLEHGVPEKTFTDDRLYGVHTSGVQDLLDSPTSRF